MPTEPVVAAAPAPAQAAAAPAAAPVVEAKAAPVVAAAVDPKAVVAPVVEEKKAEAAPAVATVPPEVTIALAEGSKLSPADLAEVQAQVKKDNLTQAQAQRALDLREGAVIQQARIQQEFEQNTQKVWLSNIQKDPEIGGDATIFPVKMEHAKLGLAQMLHPEELAEIEKAGFGNFPPFLRMGHRWYEQVMKNPNFVQGQPIAKAPIIDKSPAAVASRLYANDGRGPSKT